MIELVFRRFPVDMKGLAAGVLKPRAGDGVFQIVNLPGLIGFLGVR